MGRRKRVPVVAYYLCHCDGLPCCSFDVVFEVGLCVQGDVVCSRFTVRNFDKVKEIDF